MFDPLHFAYLAVALLVSLTIHEYSHAKVADYLGDPTPRSMGRLTLNPLAHLDPMGTIFMLFAILRGIGIGWAKPVPVNPTYMRRFSYRTSMGLTAVAGPASNFVLAVSCAILARLGVMLKLPNLVTLLFAYIVLVNVSLALFNLLPLHPLDGAKVLIGILGNIRGLWAYKLGNWLMETERWGFLPLFALLILDPYIHIFSFILGPVSNFILNILL
jgi:Zn-dependent protease